MKNHHDFTAHLNSQEAQVITTYIGPAYIQECLYYITRGCIYIVKGYACTTRRPGLSRTRSCLCRIRHCSHVHVTEGISCILRGLGCVAKSKSYFTESFALMFHTGRSECFKNRTLTGHTTSLR